MIALVAKWSWKGEILSDTGEALALPIHRPCLLGDSGLSQYNIFNGKMVLKNAIS